MRLKDIFLGATYFVNQDLTEFMLYRYHSPHSEDITIDSGTPVVATQASSTNPHHLHVLCGIGDYDESYETYDREFWLDPEWLSIEPALFIVTAPFASGSAKVRTR